MLTDRRAFLKTLLGGTLLLISGYLFKVNLYTAKLTKDETETLRAYFDVLIPTDESPSASALNIDKILITEIEKDKTLLQHTKKTCKWLNSYSTGSTQLFISLNDDNRQILVKRVAESAEGTAHRIFYESTLKMAFFHYYSNPVSWKFLHYNGPPQPNGFMNYSETPV
ncbi:gluconate 2-dehydrogenase subunit 3 family protein [Candidatus Magnetomonas plexicatena]|uniref:gluconate 2-dehydrogenase subunit 3 family protein n=1 Tax=Candidatus Magnetomonas plexicatena TaxID=2552947 RepID=UPI001102F2EE|nr:gluconate 2-dehydrogenase subunit 3 family protein [Nitrospirales bacterium LBB_01]